MSLQRLSIDQLLTTTRLSGATYINSAGRQVGVDFATTTSQAATTGTKNYTIGTNRGWVAGQTVRVVPQDNTANMSQTGTVTSYDAATGALVLNITATGSDTTTTKTAWRIGYTGPRLDHSEQHDFASLSPRAGLLLEAEPRTNSNPNGDGIGSTNGTIGSGGVLPTSWAISNTAGLTVQIIGSGTSSLGQPYVDIRVFGTPTGPNSPNITFASLTSIVAAPGELWTGSLWASIVGGSLSNIPQIQSIVQERTSGGGFITSSGANLIPTSSPKRVQRARVLTSSNVARIAHAMAITITAFGTPIDITLRLSGIQLEKVRDPVRTGTAQAGSTSTTIVLDAGASAVDGAYNGLSVVLTGGTGSGQTGVITGYVGSTKTATVQTAWTTTPDATTTFVVYSTDITTAGAASSYIPTRSGAETRQPDLWDITGFSTLWAGVQEGTLLAKVKTPTGRDVMAAVDPTFVALVQDANNFIRLHRTAPPTPTGAGQVKTLGNDQALLLGSTMADNTTGQLVMGFKLNDVALSDDGATSVTDTTTPDGIPAPTAMRLGRLNNTAPYGAFMGWVQKLRLIPRKMSNAKLETLT